MTEAQFWKFFLLAVIRLPWSGAPDHLTAFQCSAYGAWKLIAARYFRFNKES